MFTSIDTFVVICRADGTEEERGAYVLATRQLFATVEHAQDYARTISPSREAMVISGRWQQLRPATWRLPPCPMPRPWWNKAAK